jgi:hypothetical protein
MHACMHVCVCSALVNRERYTSGLGGGFQWLLRIILYCYLILYRYSMLYCYIILYWYVILYCAHVLWPSTPWLVSKSAGGPPIVILYILFYVILQCKMLSAKSLVDLFVVGASTLCHVYITLYIYIYIYIYI